MVEFNPGIDDDFDPRVDNPDTLPSDPDISVKLDPQGAPSFGAFTIVLPLGGAPIPLLHLDIARTRARVRSLTGSVMIGDAATLINGMGFVIPSTQSEEITTTNEVYAVQTGGADATATVWIERAV